MNDAGIRAGEDEQPENDAVPGKHAEIVSGHITHQPADADERRKKRAHGADAAAFLQGQLTQDVVGLRAGEARLAGYCSAKGRLLASFIGTGSAPCLSMSSLAAVHDL